jgi:hypothetical protein
MLDWIESWVVDSRMVWGDQELTMRRSFAPCRTLAWTCVDDMIEVCVMYEKNRRLQMIEQETDGERRRESIST